MVLRPVDDVGAAAFYIVSESMLRFRSVSGFATGIVQYSVLPLLAYEPNCVRKLQSSPLIMRIPKVATVRRRASLLNMDAEPGASGLRNGWVASIQRLPPLVVCTLLVVHVQECIYMN